MRLGLAVVQSLNVQLNLAEELAVERLHFYLALEHSKSI
jgi:hypothetical protein